jgi:hypothetical protein
VAFQARAGEWQEIEVDLASPRETSILRLYLPNAAEPVELDWVELKPTGGKARRWDF